MAQGQRLGDPAPKAELNQAVAGRVLVATPLQGLEDHHGHQRGADHREDVFFTRQPLISTAPPSGRSSCWHTSEPQSRQMRESHRRVRTSSNTRSPQTGNLPHRERRQAPLIVSRATFGALLTLGCNPAEVASALTWMARSVTGEGVAARTERHAPLRYYAGKCGPGFVCGANNQLPCAWGAVKVMLAFGAWPVERRTPLITRAIAQGVDFLFSTNPATAAYPSGFSAKPSRSWWQFGFPVFYVTDVRQLAEALVALGYGSDPRLAATLACIASKGAPHGLEYTYSGKTWADFGPKDAPNPWVTLRALRVLMALTEA